MSPKETRMTDAECRYFIEQYNFGSLITGDLHISHIPFVLIEDNVIETHLVKSNPQLGSLDGASCLLNVTGPHAFISSASYLTQPAVPTWNYAAVNIRGTSTLFAGESLSRSLDKLLGLFQPELLTDKQALPDDFRSSLERAITGVRIEISEISGKLKLGQHRSPADQQQVFQRLSNRQGSDSLYAEFAQTWLEKFRPSVLGNHR